MSTRIHYDRLTPLARSIIRDHGITVADYVRKAGRWSDGDWHGDRCGCTDDRCIGFHHEQREDCGCLIALIEVALGWTYPAFHAAAPGSRQLANGGCTGMGIRRPGGNCLQCGWSGSNRVSRDDVG